MEKKLRIYSLWAIDDLSKTQILKGQLDTMKSLGFNGAVFHPRNYSGIPEYLGKSYMERVSEIILYAKSIGMDIWLYDENGWPSGSADGKVEALMPELCCYWLENDNGKVIKKSRHGINSLDKSGVELFVKLTHEGYKNGLSPEAFDWVGGFFSDEVGFLEGHGACMDRGGIPWSDEVAERYEKKFGGNVERELTKLFCEKEDSFKAWYWETLTDILTENFYGTIEDWCEQNGKLFTAHLKGEEDPLFQIGYSGSCCRVLSRISVPGIDVLERSVGNSYYTKIASSVSRQLGSGIAMAEVMGGAGWGLTPGDVKRYTDRLIDDGINMFVFHINQEHLNYTGITDWPSSIPCHQPWRGAFTQLTDGMIARERDVKTPDTLLISPVRGVMENFEPSLIKGMNEHDGSAKRVSYAQSISEGVVMLAERLSSAGIVFDVTDERTAEMFGKVENGLLAIGRCSYKHVLYADGCSFTERGQELLNSVGAKWCGETFLDGAETEKWTFRAPETNRYIIEISDGAGVAYAEYICDCELTVSDKCVCVKLNGCTLKEIAEDEYGHHYRIDSHMLRIGSNTFELEGIDKAFACLSGKFAVKNRYPYFEQDERQYVTENGFYICEPTQPSNDLIVSGYPFSTEPIICEKRIRGGINGMLRFDCRRFAAAHVFVDGHDLGWVYEGSEEIVLDRSYDECTLCCKVFQSAYNLYGPHHHIEGDRPLVSPAQFEGVKNFADTPLLQEKTSDKKFRLVRWNMPEHIEIIKHR